MPDPTCPKCSQPLSEDEARQLFENVPEANRERILRGLMRRKSEALPRAGEFKRQGGRVVFDRSEMDQDPDSEA